MLRTEGNGEIRFIKLVQEFDGQAPGEIAVAVAHIVSLQKIYHQGDMLARPENAEAAEAPGMSHTFRVYLTNGQTFLARIATEGGQRVMHAIFDSAV